MVDVLSQLFADAGNTLRATATGFRSGHEPVHSSSSGACVSIDPAQGVWYCHSCQQGGDAAGGEECHVARGMKWIVARS